MTPKFTAVIHYDGWATSTFAFETYQQAVDFIGERQEDNGFDFGFVETRHREAEQAHPLDALAKAVATSMTAGKAF